MGPMPVAAFPSARPMAYEALGLYTQILATDPDLNRQVDEGDGAEQICQVR